MKRLTTGSPNRIHTIKYILGNGQVGDEKKRSVTSFQGYPSSYNEVKKLALPLNDQQIKTFAHNVEPKMEYGVALDFKTPM